MSTIPITRPSLGEREQRAAAEVIASGWVAQGTRVARFERMVADYVGAAHAVAVSSGTTALHLALIASGVGPGDEVIVPALSFIASANAVAHARARPVLVDVDPKTYNLDPAAAGAAVTSRTRALLPVHQLGLAADMDALEDLARQHALMIVEDGACALGSTYHGRQIGASSRSCCFSFHPRKIITTGEGGMITTDDAEIAARLRTLRSQGIPSDALSRAQRGQLDAEPIRELGYNYRMTDIQAAVGIVQMERLPLLLERRRRLARRYDELLDRLGEVARPEDPWLDPQTGTSSHAYQSYMVVLDSERSRAAAVRYLQRQQIASRPGITAIHEQPLYQRSGRSRRLPNTERLARRGLLLPLYADLTEAEQDRVVQALAAALG